MSYDKQTWTSGEVITATKLNHMEDGIDSAGGGAVLINVTVNGHELVLDKTFKEIETLMKAGVPIMLKEWIDTPVSADFDSIYSHGLHTVCSSISLTRDDVDLYYVITNGATNYVATTENDYPSFNYWD